MKHKGMSVVLLVKVEGSDSLYRVSTYERMPFAVWDDENGIDLYWRGRRVEKVYSMGESCECWWSVPIESACRSLKRRGKAGTLLYRPLSEGKLPS